MRIKKPPHPTTLPWEGDGVFYWYSGSSFIILHAQKELLWLRHVLSRRLSIPPILWKSCVPCGAAPN